MGRLLLLNDVATEMDALLTGDKDLPASEEGEQQSKFIADFVIEKCQQIDYIASSDAQRITKLVHHFRFKHSKKKYKPYVGLRERNFGVLTGAPYSLNSDMFQHSRICAEGGESVQQCRLRVMQVVNELCQEMNCYILMISHPFTCQIIHNVLCNRAHTIVENFWMRKGSLGIYQYNSGAYGLNWKLLEEVNVIPPSQG